MKILILKIFISIITLLMIIGVVLIKIKDKNYLDKKDIN